MTGLFLPVYCYLSSLIAEFQNEMGKYQRAGVLCRSSALYRRRAMDLLIIRDAFKGTRRFEGFHKNLG